MARPQIHLDFETRSWADLKRRGAMAYAQDLTTEVLCLCAKVKGTDEKVEWDALDGRGPDDWNALLRAWPTATVHAWNALFEVAIWTHVLPRYGEVHPLNPARIRCTMARAYSLALPGKLEACAKVLGLRDQKDMEGHALMKRICSPRKLKRGGPLSLADPTPEERRRNIAYCHADVATEMGVDDALGPLPRPDQELFTLDLVSQLRGIRIDRAAIRDVRPLVAQVEDKLSREFRGITGGLGPKQHAKVLEWLRGLVPDWTGTTEKEYVELRLAQGGLPEDVRQALELRQAVNQSSIAKLGAMLEWSGGDGVSRGTTQVFGAGQTGRWAGRGWQPQNLPRPKINMEEGDDPHIGMEELVDLMRTATLEELAAHPVVKGDTFSAVSTMLRGMLIPDLGHVFVGADLASIEARVLAAFAGERWKLQAFRDNDNGIGKKIYCIAAEKVFGYEVESKKTHPKEYAVGKVCELAFGYQGGYGAWYAFDNSGRHSREQIESYKDGWRSGHLGVKAFWPGVEAAAIEAVLNPGVDVSYGPVTYRCEGFFLACQLPSGRCIYYAEPTVRQRAMPWTDKNDNAVYRPALHYRTWKNNHWMSEHTYGGKLTENIVQAASRDILVDGYKAAEKAGLPVHFTVHDELVATLPDLSVDKLEEYVRQLERAMVDFGPDHWTQNVRTADGTTVSVPLAAEGGWMRRFSK